MIARLQGTIALKELSFIIVDVSGVGYKVFVPVHVLSVIKQGENAVVFTYMHVRDDALELYGFMDNRDLRLFEMLIGVSGIGCKTALSIFGNGTRDEIVSAILRADTAFFTGVPRLGTKNSQKLIIELKGKLGDGSAVALDSLVGDGGEDVVEALKSFGYTQKEALEAFKHVRDTTKDASGRIKLALKYLGK